VEDYIEEHLDSNLSLEKLAEVASFSKYHFHRVFYMMTGERLSRFIQRVRLEKAATTLLLAPETPVTTVALACGFASSQSLAKSFKERYDCSPTEWRAQANHVPAANSNLSNTERKQRNASKPPKAYISYNRDSILWRYKMETREQTVEVRTFEPMTLAYVRHVGPYQGDGALFEQLWNRLMSWAGPRDLVVPGTTTFLTIYHDSPEITDDDKLRLSVCISVPDGTEVSGEVGKLAFAGGKYAVGYFELGEKDYGEAWGFMYGTWLPESGYVPDDRPSFEMYPMDESGQSGDTFTGKRPVQICIPVQPL
jgi:AraC family transcriptional regulator